MTIARRRPVDITDAPEHRSIPMDRVELRDDNPEELTLTGYAATFEPYEMYGGPKNCGWIEQIDRNAFDKTLREKPDLHLLINHAGMPLARTKSGTLSLSVDDHGLRVEARLDRRDPEVRSLEVKMRRGDMDEMSFAFRVKAQEWSAAPGYEDLDDQTFRLITEVSLHKGDVSVVNFGANPTTHAEVKSIPEALKVIAEADERELAEVRSDEDVANLKVAQERLAAARGVATPQANIERDNVVEGDEARGEEGVSIVPAIGVDTAGEIVFAKRQEDGTLAPIATEALAEAMSDEETGAWFGTLLAGIVERHPVGLIEGLNDTLDGLAEVVTDAVGEVLGLTPDSRDKAEAKAETEEASEPSKGMSLRYAQALLED